MIHQRGKILPVALAWAAGWLLVSLGQAISDVYSSPKRGLTAVYVLGLAGWAIAAAVTIRYVRRQFGADGHVTALSAAGWAAGALVAVVMGTHWLFTWNAGFFGLIAGPALGAVIGGAFTLPMRSLSPAGVILRASLLGAFIWGLVFLIFQTVAFYAWYFLFAKTVNSLYRTVGPVWALIIVGIFPAGIGGFLAGLIAASTLAFSGRQARKR
jgi:hypothetical protein